MSKQPETAAAAVQSKSQLELDPKYIGRITGILLAICVVTALLLGIVNQVTAPRIEAIEAEKVRAAMNKVLPADEYMEWESELPGEAKSLYQARSNGEDIGWVVETETSGSQGKITMMIGIDTSGGQGKVTGVSVVSHSETPNIGTKVVNDQSVLDRFIGMSHENGEITVNSGSNRFDGISGATVSSRGVTAGVNIALDAVTELYEGGLVK